MKSNAHKDRTAQWAGCLSSSCCQTS